MLVKNKKSFKFEESDAISFKKMCGHLNKGEVALRIGISSTRLSNIIHGRCWITETMFKKIFRKENFR